MKKEKDAQPFSCSHRPLFGNLGPQADDRTGQIAMFWAKCDEQNECYDRDLDQEHGIRVEHPLGVIHEIHICLRV